MNRVKKVSRLWERQRPRVLAERERDRRRRRARQTAARIEEARRARPGE